MMQKFLNRAFLAGLLIVLLAVPLGVMLWSHRETSAYYENRSLASVPALTWEGFWDGSFGSSFESWYSDHAPGRTTWLKLDTAVQMKLLKRPVVNDVVLDADGTLLPKMEFSEYSEEAYRYAGRPIAEKFGKLNQYIEEQESQFLYVGLPEQRVYFEDRFPDYMNSHKTEAAVADEVFAELMTEEGVAFLDMREIYAKEGNPENYYSKVDHHYRYYGAYVSYRAILDKLSQDGWDLPVLTEDDIAFVELEHPYIGSRNRKLYNLWNNGEKAVIGVQKESVSFVRTDNGELSEKPLFVTPASEIMPATYNMYMGGDFAETVLQTDRPELPDALIFGDSFTNAMETLLYTAFDETRILDLRHYTKQSLKDYIAQYQPDVVLCIQNDTFYYTASGNSAVWED